MTDSIIGREPELAELEEGLRAGASIRALMISGEPGIGKTTLWLAAVAAARARGVRVMAARPSGAEARLSFATLADLLEGVDIDGLAGVPRPQLRALRVALLWAEPAEDYPDVDHQQLESRAISAGLLGALRALSQAGPLLVAIDDVQWLDASSNEALTFAARRLNHPVQFLLTRRSGSATEIECALEPAGLRLLEVPALSLGAIHHLLSERTGLSLSRRLLREVFELSMGNPLFALELGRMLARRGAARGLSGLPLPTALDDLFGPRLRELSAPVRRTLLAVALSGIIRRSELEQAVDPLALEDALSSELLMVDGGRVAACHPLLASAALRHSTAGQRRELHLALSVAAEDGTMRARHLALASSGADSGLAGVIAIAAATAYSRGAQCDAVELSEHALRLTPRGAPERPERLLALARHLNAVGDLQRMSDLLAPEIDSLPAGVPRARAWLLFADGGDVLTTGEYVHRLDRALRESPNDAGVRATVLAKKAHVAAIGWVERIPEAEDWALEALRTASRAGPEAERIALGALAWTRVLRGRPVTDLTERFAQLPGVGSLAADWYSPGAPAASRLIWRGEVNEARAALTSLLSLADEHGDAGSYTMLRFVLCDLELRVGDLDSAERFLDEFGGSDRDVVMSPNYEYSRALLAARRGQVEETRRWADETIARAREAGIGWDRLEALGALGMASIFAGEPELAVRTLRKVWEHAQREGVTDPGAFAVAPGLVEALASIGAVEEARAVNRRLGDLAEAQDHPWGLATAERCAALIQLASGYDERAAAALDGAAAEYGRLGLAFDRARCLLLLGQTARRYRKRGVARRSLEEAATAFDRIGAPGWAEQARSELSRLGARKPTPEGQLSPAESRVVELAASGLSNKEIARHLFVSPHTVELHLSHAYAKLGIHSRAQLVSRMSARAEPTSKN